MRFAGGLNKRSIPAASSKTSGMQGNIFPARDCCAMEGDVSMEGDVAMEGDVSIRLLPSIRLVESISLAQSISLDALMPFEFPTVRIPTRSPAVMPCFR